MTFLLAEAADAGGASGLVSFLPLVLIGAFVYFAMIRPQRKRQQAVQQMQKQLDVGSDVITIGGLHGRVDSIGDETVDLLLTDDVVVRFKRSAIAEVVSGELAEPDDEDAAEPTE